MDRHPREVAHPRFIDYVVDVARQPALVFATRHCWWVIHDLCVPLLARHGSFSRLLLRAGSAGGAVFLWMPAQAHGWAAKGNDKRKDRSSAVNGKKFTHQSPYPPPSHVANKDTYEVVLLYILHSKGVKAFIMDNKGLNGSS